MVGVAEAEEGGKRGVEVVAEVVDELVGDGEARRGQLNKEKDKVNTMVRSQKIRWR